LLSALSKGATMPGIEARSHGCDQMVFTKTML